MSFIYIAPLVDKTSYKIGKSRNPSNRILALSKYYHFDFKNIDFIDCKSETDAYKFENILHCACDKSRVIMEYDGGTEFFDFKTYEDTLSLVKIVIKMNDFDLIKMPDVTNIKNFDAIEQDDIKCLMNSITNKLKNKRLEYNISQKQLAIIAGISPNTIRNMESNNFSITLENFIKVLKSLDLDHLLSDFEVCSPTRKRSR